MFVEIGRTSASNWQAHRVQAATVKNRANDFSAELPKPIYIHRTTCSLPIMPLFLCCMRVSN